MKNEQCFTTKRHELFWGSGTRDQGLGDILVGIENYQDSQAANSNPIPHSPFPKKCLALFLVFLATVAFGQFAFGQGFELEGALEWDKMEINAVISLELASANVKLPAGRNLGEAMINSEYLRFLRPGILGLQADSSATLGDLVDRGELSIIEIEETVLNTRRTPSYLSPDLLRLCVSYLINMADLSGSLIRHNSPMEIRRTLVSSSATAYTGIIIIASSTLPVHGMKSEALAVPCLFPKIWDSGMNLIFERNMLERGRKSAARYAPARSIFYESPSGLSPEIAALVGSKPLKVFARGLFGIKATDLVIDAEDALLIISSEENRRLLSEGKIVIILDDSMLKKPLTGG
jgi:hypothetical protein